MAHTDEKRHRSVPFRAGVATLGITWIVVRFFQGGNSDSMRGAHMIESLGIA